MTFELSDTMEARLRDVASEQGRDLALLVEEAIKWYLEALMITDVEESDVAETQTALLGELGPLPDWE